MKIQVSLVVTGYKNKTANVTPVVSLHDDDWSVISQQTIREAG